jgi:2-polyprenyl-3-methyl-5-hydroxy-6-metoxy-1,4-benzoquinol methylase
MIAPSGNDQAGRLYWDSVWTDAELPEPIDPSDSHFRNRLNRVFAAYFDRVLVDLPPGARLLEVGCARSQWLPYFAQKYSVNVSGIDYSEVGCTAEQEILRRAKVTGEVIHADLFDPPHELFDAFDVVVSLGVVEHFQDTAACIRAIARFVKPGGAMITTIPNMTGSLGFVQRAVNRAVFEIHQPLTASALARAHRDAGLRVETTGYLVSTNYGVANLHGLPESLRTRCLRFVLLQLTRLSKLAWIFEDRFKPLPATRMFGAYVACSAQRKHELEEQPS